MKEFSSFPMHLELPEDSRLLAYTEFAINLEKKLKGKKHSPEHRAFDTLLALRTAQNNRDLLLAGMTREKVFGLPKNPALIGIFDQTEGLIGTIEGLEQEYITNNPLNKDLYNDAKKEFTATLDQLQASERRTILFPYALQRGIDFSGVRDADDLLAHPLLPTAIEIDALSMEVALGQVYSIYTNLQSRIFPDA
jgi:hypothetical protein